MNTAEIGQTPSTTVRIWSTHAILCQMPSTLGRNSSEFVHCRPSLGPRIPCEILHVRSRVRVCPKPFWLKSVFAPSDLYRERRAAARPRLAKMPAHDMLQTSHSEYDEETASKATEPPPFNPKAAFAQSSSPP